RPNIASISNNVPRVLLRAWTNFSSEDIICDVPVRLIYHYHDVSMAQERIDDVDTVTIQKLCNVGCNARRIPGVHRQEQGEDRKSTRLNSSHEWISYAV